MVGTPILTDQEPLQTKYRRPELSRNTIARRPIYEKLDRSLIYKVTGITAPAGYGKTTAVADWVARNDHVDRKAFWLTLEPADNEPIRFWTCFFTCLEGALPGISKAAEAELASSEMIESNLHLRSLMVRMENAQRDFLILLDDAHFIQNQSILHGLSYLIQHMPARMHLIVMGRSELIEEHSSLELYEASQSLGTEDLRFRGDEIREFFALRGDQLKEGKIREIEEYTEGWPAALVDLALLMEENREISGFLDNQNGCSQRLRSYLDENVFGTLSVRQRSFLISTSILDRFCEPLCQAVTGETDLLEELCRNQVFLVPLDREGTWFRYHGLFRAFLQQKREELLFADPAELLEKAGDWLYGNRYYNQAILSYIKGSHFQKAVDALEANPLRLGERGGYYSLYPWLLNIPEGFAAHSPIALTAIAGCLQEKSDFGKATELFRRAIALLEQEDWSEELDARISYHILTRVRFYLLNQDLESLLLFLQYAADKLAEKNKKLEFFDSNRCEISLYRSHLHPLLNLENQDGEKFDAAMDCLLRMMRIDTGYPALLRGEWHYEHNHLEKGLQYAVAAAEAAGKIDYSGVQVPATLTIAKIKRAEGDLAGAVRMVELLREELESKNRSHWVAKLDAFLARLHLDLGEMEQAREWAGQSGLNPYHEITRDKEYELIVYARVLVAQQQYSDAATLLHRLLFFTERSRRDHSKVELCNLLAIGAYLNRKENAAVEYLERSLAIGQSHQYFRSFLDEDGVMLDLLKVYPSRCGEKRKTSAYAKGLLKAAEEDALCINLAQHNTPDELILTRQERIVFDCILKGHTNLEIAEELGVSHITVKVHASHIYKKLGVHNRVDCIRKFKNDTRV